MWKACYSFFKLSHANTLSTVVLGSINRLLKSSTLLRRQTKEKIKTNGKVEQKDRLTTSIRNGRNENGRERLHSQEKYWWNVATLMGHCLQEVRTKRWWNEKVLFMCFLILLTNQRFLPSLDDDGVTGWVPSPRGLLSPLQQCYLYRIPLPRPVVLGLKAAEHSS